MSGHPDTRPPQCMHCSGRSRLVTGRVVYPRRPDLAEKLIWLCQCGARVGCHPGGTRSLGRPANEELRKARMAVHAKLESRARQTLRRRQGNDLLRPARYNLEGCVRTVGFRPGVSATARKPLTRAQRVKVWETSDGLCCVCAKPIDRQKDRWIDEHIKPLAMGGSNHLKNRGPAHEGCAQDKTKVDKGQIAQAVKRKAGDIGAGNRPKRPMPGAKDSPVKITVDQGAQPREKPAGRQSLPPRALYVDDPDKVSPSRRSGKPPRSQP